MAGMLVEVVDGDASAVLHALRVAVAAGDDAARMGQHGLVALVGVGARVPVDRLAEHRIDGADVVADHDVVAEAVAGQTLAPAVADVVQSRPRVGRGRRLVVVEVAAGVHGDLADREGVDAVEHARDPQRLDEVAALERVGDHRVADRRTVAAGAARDHEVGVVGRDRARDDPRDAADVLEVVVPEPAAPRQQLVRRRVDQGGGVAVLAVDLAARVHHEQLALIVRQHDGVHAEGAVGADATGDVVDEALHDLARGGADRGQGAARNPVDRRELAADVDGGVGRVDRGRLAVRVGGEAEHGRAGDRVDRGDLALGHAVDGVEGPDDEELGPVGRGLDLLHTAAAEGGTEVRVDEAGIEVEREQGRLVVARGVGPPVLDRAGPGAGDVDPVADVLDVGDVTGRDERRVGPGDVVGDPGVPGPRLTCGGRRRHRDRSRGPAQRGGVVRRVHRVDAV